MAVFPSVDWFDEVRNVFNADDRYRGAGGGYCNCEAGFKIADRVFVLTFDGFECSAATEGDDGVLDDVDMPIEPFAGRDCLYLRQPWGINRMQRLESRSMEPWTFR